MSSFILALSSSPRPDSNSDLLCDSFLQGASHAGHRTEKVRLEDKTIRPCTGCGTCINGKKSCPITDDMPTILAQMIAADIIVMATPVYFYTMNGQMKTLIDRTCSRYTEISGKEFFFIIAAADSNKQLMERTIEGFRGFTACLTGAKERGVIYGVGAWDAGTIRGKPAMQEAFTMGRGL